MTDPNAAASGAAGTPATDAQHSKAHMAVVGVLGALESVLSEIYGVPQDEIAAINRGLSFLARRIFGAK